MMLYMCYDCQEYWETTKAMSCILYCTRTRLVSCINNYPWCDLKIKGSSVAISDSETLHRSDGKYSSKVELVSG